MKLKPNLLNLLKCGLADRGGGGLADMCKAQVTQLVPYEFQDTLNKLIVVLFFLWEFGPG
jgi:hypothetical protein